MTEANHSKWPVDKGSLVLLTRAGIFKFSVAHFLVALVMLFIAFPVIDNLHDGDLIGSSLITLVLVFGVLAVGRRRSARIMGVALCIPAFLAQWATHINNEFVRPETVLMLELVFIIFLLLQMLRYILTTPLVNSEVLCAGISVYLLFGLLWTFAYLLVVSLDPLSFNLVIGETTKHTLTGFEAFYFSFVTLTTMGYGDITPVGKIARTLAMLEAMVGVLYLAVMVARLVALYSEHNPNPEGTNANG